jgi:peptidyl-tRNA hydrolase, PTH2 family
MAVNVLIFMMITKIKNYFFRSRKIVVEANNTNQLIKVCSEGKIHKIPFFCVHDAGLTEVEPNSFTALAFFGSDQELKPVTGKLRLLK